MQERVLSLKDLHESELTAIKADIDKLGDGSDYSIDEQAGKVTIRDPAESSLDEDPRKGVMENAPPMSDAVRKRLEEPFAREDAAANGPEPVDDPEPVEDAEVEFNPDPADIRNFIRATLGNVRYTKSYSRYNSAVKFTLGARTQRQDEDCVYHAEGLSDFRFMLEISKTRLAYSLVDLRIGEKIYKLLPVQPGVMRKAASDDSDLVAAVKAAEDEPSILESDVRVSELMELPQHIVSIITAALSDFDTLMIELQRRADDPKFWKTDTAD